MQVYKLVYLSVNSRAALTLSFRFVMIRTTLLNWEFMSYCVVQNEMAQENPLRDYQPDSGDKIRAGVAG